MHPGRPVADDAKISLSSLMPPVTVYSDDTFRVHGPHMKAVWETIEPLVLISAITMEKLRWLAERT
jgi:hypothetical protein